MINRLAMLVIKFHIRAKDMRLDPAEHPQSPRVLFSPSVAPFRHLSMFAAIVFDTMPHPTRCDLENSATYAPLLLDPSRNARPL